MYFPITVYYPTEAERREMNELIKLERKAFKKAGIKCPADMGLTHGGLLLALGRLWRADGALKGRIREGFGGIPGGINGSGKPLVGGKNQGKKRSLNAKSKGVRHEG